MRPMQKTSHVVPSADLEACLCAVEDRLSSIADSLRERDVRAVEHHSGELHRALAAAVQRFGHAARTGGVPPRLRHRFAAAGRLVAAQRESLARATAALDRAIEVLLPDAAMEMQPSVHCAEGSTERSPATGAVQA
jgi:hypothetical protein